MYKLGLDSQIDIAINLLKEYCPPEGYYLGFSGGKDSLVVKTLADMACVSYDAHFNKTSVDPPEVINYIRQYHSDVSIDNPPETMWQLIIRKGSPPTRLNRYCCRTLKEYGGVGRIVLGGVKKTDSRRRRKYKSVTICSDDNKTFVSPILLWTDEDVWEFIHRYSLPYCSLYNEGFDRVGCVLCPNAYWKQREYHCQRFPGFYKAYLRCFEKMLAERKRKGLETTWNSAEDVMSWWIYGREKVPEGQLILELGGE